MTRSPSQQSLIRFALTFSLLFFVGCSINLSPDGGVPSIYNCVDDTQCAQGKPRCKALPVDLSSINDGGSLFSGACVECIANADCPAHSLCGNDSACHATEWCGNNICAAQSGEACGSCPEDCGACPVCGDKKCSPEVGETCKNCTQDCGPCPYCGDGKCDKMTEDGWCLVDCLPQTMNNNCLDGMTNQCSMNCRDAECLICSNSVVQWSRSFYVAAMKCSYNECQTPCDDPNTPSLACYMCRVSAANTVCGDKTIACAKGMK